MKSDHKDIYMKAKTYTKETIHSLGQYHRSFPNFNVGDTIAVSQWVQEGDTKRVQIFEGTVIGMHKRGASSSFIVRKISANAVAVERIYPLYSPMIESIKLVSKSKVRRAKLYYLRDVVGKKSRLKEDISAKAKKRSQESMITGVAVQAAPAVEQAPSE
jgi:large subunit ribosomal protein L19